MYIYLFTQLSLYLQICFYLYLWLIFDLAHFVEAHTLQIHTRHTFACTSGNSSSPNPYMPECTSGNSSFRNPYMPEMGMHIGKLIVSKSIHAEDQHAHRETHAA